MKMTLGLSVDEADNDSGSTAPAEAEQAAKQTKQVSSDLSIAQKRFLLTYEYPAGQQASLANAGGTWLFHHCL